MSEIYDTPEKRAARSERIGAIVSKLGYWFLMFPEVPSKMSGVAVDDDNAIRRLVYAKERTKSFGDLRIDRSKMTALMQMVSATDSKLLFITSIEGKWYHVDGLGHQHGVYSGQIVNAQRGDAPDDAFIIDKKYLVPVP